MNIYSIERRGHVGVDEAYAVIVAADSVEEARKRAAEHAFDEGPEPWLDQTASVCKRQGRASRGFGPVLSGKPAYLLCQAKRSA